MTYSGLVIAYVLLCVAAPRLVLKEWNRPVLNTAVGHYKEADIARLQAQPPAMPSARGICKVSRRWRPACGGIGAFIMPYCAPGFGGQTWALTRIALSRCPKASL